LSKRLGQPFVIENQPGAAAISQPRCCARSCDNLKFDFIATSTDRWHSVGADRQVVNPSVSVHTVPEFAAYAKANPGNQSRVAEPRDHTPVASELFKQ
jgi:hypothetical protein